jgi:hypothetical protein
MTDIASRFGSIMLGLAVIGALTYLGAAGVVDGATIGTIFGAIAGAGGGVAAHNSGVKTGVRAAHQVEADRDNS